MKLKNLGKVAAIGVAPVAALASGLFGGGGGGAPELDPRVAQTARQMADIGSESFSWNKDQSTRIMPQFDRASTQVAGISQDVGARANTMDALYQDVFAPVIGRVGADAMGFDSQEAQDRAAGDAATQVAQAFRRSRGRQGATLAALGLNPAQYMSQQQELDAQQAIAEAGAANAAREGRRMNGIQLRQQAAGLGRGVAGDANAANQLELGAATASPTIAASGVQFRNEAVGSALPWMQASNSALLGVNQAQQNIYNAEQQRKAAQAQGIGQLIGTGVGFAVGGPMGAMVGSQLGGAAGAGAGK